MCAIRVFLIVFLRVTTSLAISSGENKAFKYAAKFPLLPEETNFKEEFLLHINKLTINFGYSIDVLLTYNMIKISISSLSEYKNVPNILYISAFFSVNGIASIICSSIIIKFKYNIIND